MNPGPQTENLPARTWLNQMTGMVFRRKLFWPAVGSTSCTFNQRSRYRADSCIMKHTQMDIILMSGRQSNVTTLPEKFSTRSRYSGALKSGCLRLLVKPKIPAVLDMWQHLHTSVGVHSFGLQFSQSCPLKLISASFVAQTGKFSLPS